MKKLIKLFVMLLPLTSIAAENFKRVQSENEYFKDYSREELSAKLGATRSLLPQYNCNGRDEFDLFWMPKKSDNHKSLRVQLYKTNQILTYVQGKYFDNAGLEVTDLSDIFLKYLVPVLATLETIPETNKMLRLLEQAPYPLTIMFGGNSFTPKEENGLAYKGIYMSTAISIFDHGRMTSEAVPFYDIGVGGNINWDPKTKDLPGAVTLAHEMYHSLDSVRGILDMRFIDGENYESAFVSEYRAVYMENIVRKASGIVYRSHYGSDQSGPGVLDEKGEPRFISSPCLR